MNSGSLLQTLGVGLAIALLLIAATRKMFAPAPLRAWLQKVLPRWPVNGLMATLITFEIVLSLLLIASPEHPWTNVAIVSACLCLLVFQWALRRFDVGTCPCLGGSDSLHPDAPARSVLLVSFVNGLAVVPESLFPLSVTAWPWLIGLSMCAFVMALSGIGAPSTRTSSTTPISAALRQAIVTAMPTIDEAKTFANRGSIFFGSLDCQGCVQYGQQYAELARRFPSDWTAFIDMDVQPPSPTRMGGAQVLRLGLSLRRELGLRIRPALIVWEGGAMHIHQGPGPCAIAFAELLSNTAGDRRRTLHIAGNQA